ncbi:hypothetical protein GPECTOR_30g221 [Gonium pectorale]|uniref:RNB domain-containing protein n=1 Tax=Gonium pectorale TaxID=33097 RepID=A0A150GEX5_GONPE|nr:hypothetical protein GPECTOR_30g221 [Gonium pectorale]|eukprot:KXZ48125.1 hypothetical protein GPECTOR_30g221 [Gonium pectorale]
MAAHPVAARPTYRSHAGALQGGRPTGGAAPPSRPASALAAAQPQAVSAAGASASAGGGITSSGGNAGAAAPRAAVAPRYGWQMPAALAASRHGTTAAVAAATTASGAMGAATAAVGAVGAKAPAAADPGRQRRVAAAAGAGASSFHNIAGGGSGALTAGGSTRPFRNRHHSLLGGGHGSLQQQQPQQLQTQIQIQIQQHVALARAIYAARLQWAASGGQVLPAASSAQGTLQVGSLVEFDKNDRGVLALVVAPDGKKNWFVVDTSGRRQSMVPKQVTLLLPGGPYGEADLAAFAAAAEGADMSLLEIAWEIALEGGSPLGLRDLASLLFDDTSPTATYVTHRMLRSDSLFFKQSTKGGAAVYTARGADEVAALRRQQEAAEAARQEAAGWKAAVAAARGAKTRAAQPGAAEWAAGPYAARIAAVKAVALGSPRLDEAGTALALSSLQLAGAGARADPDAAAGLLTELGVFRRHEPLALLRRGIAEDHPAATEREAQALLAYPPPDPDADSRRDLTSLRVFTIDDASTTEVDDGLSVEPAPGGSGIRIWIHVADPTRWIAPGSGLDLAGRERTRTLYLPWGSVPMFPRCLAEGPFSLRGGEVCDAMSVGVVLGRDGSLSQPIVTPSRVRVSHKLTYDQADGLLAAAEAAEAGTAAEAAAEAGTAAAADGCDAAAVADLVELRRAAVARRAYREARGCIEIPLPEAKIHVPYAHLDRGRPSVSIRRISQWESASRSLVAEMMILAGEAVGAIGAEASLPLPYRAQDAPDLPPAATLAALPDGPCRGFALKRCMTRSSVAAEPARHASLALDAYVQFTSPIRRYADLVAHANLKAWLRGQPLPYSAAAIDGLAGAAAEAGRELGAAERESESYWVAEYLRLNWGAEYPAMALGWQREELSLAAFLLEEQGLEVVAKVPPGTAFAPGDRCVLAPSEANPATGFYRFYVAGWTSGGAAEEEEEEGAGEGEGEEGEGEEGEVQG